MITFVFDSEDCLIEILNDPLNVNNLEPVQIQVVQESLDVDVENVEVIQRTVGDWASNEW